MASAGEALLENVRNTPPEDVVTTDAVDSAADAPPEPEKPRRPRKPKTELAAEAPAEPVADAVVDTPAPEQPAWLQRVTSELGFENVTNPDDAGNRMVELALQQRQDRERLEREYEQRLRDAEYRSQVAAPVAPAPVEDRKPWQPPVAYPEAATRYITRKEDGTADWKPETPAEVRNQAEKFVAWRDEMAETIQTRPDKFFGEILPAFIQEHVKQYVEPFYEERTKAEQVNQYLTQFENDNAEWLFARDPLTGQPNREAMSRIGDELRERLHVHMERGYTPEEAMTYAQYDIQRRTNQTPWVKQEPAPAQIRQQIRQQKRTEHLRKGGAGSVPNRSGSFTEPEDGVPQNGNLSPGRSLMQRAKREGVSLPYEPQAS